MRRIKPVKAKVNGFVVEIAMNDGSVIERDFTFVRGPAFRKWRGRDGIDRRVRLHVSDDGSGELSWPGDIDFCLDAVIWGGRAPRKPRRPIPRAVVGVEGRLIPSPWGIR